jgi:hypothetical protein
VRKYAGQSKSDAQEKLGDDDGIKDGLVLVEGEVLGKDDGSCDGLSLTVGVAVGDLLNVGTPVGSAVGGSCVGAGVGVPGT